MPRGRSNRSPVVQKTLRIFCEGEKTEPYYLNGYLRDFRNTNRAAVIEIQPTRKNTPVQLVEEAISLKKSSRSLPGDEFWVVYDRESTVKYPRSKHSEAWGKAVKAGVNIALNNVCFEYWLLIHLINTSASYTSYDDLRANSQLRAEIMKLCGKDYEKSSQILFPHLKPLIGNARMRALQINARGIAAHNAGALPFDINPFIGMPSILDAIDNFK